MKKLSPSLLISSLLRPIVRLCLKQGLRLAEIDEQLRKVLVEFLAALSCHVPKTYESPPTLVHPRF